MLKKNLHYIKIYRQLKNFKGTLPMNVVIQKSIDSSKQLTSTILKTDLSSEDSILCDLNEVTQNDISRVKLTSSPFKIDSSSCFSIDKTFIHKIEKTRLSTKHSNYYKRITKYICNLNDQISSFKKTVIEFENNELEKSINNRLHNLIQNVNKAFNDLFNKLNEKSIQKTKNKKIISRNEKKYLLTYKEKILTENNELNKTYNLIQEYNFYIHKNNLTKTDLLNPELRFKEYSTITQSLSNKNYLDAKKFIEIAIQTAKSDASIDYHQSMLYFYNQALTYLNLDDTKGFDDSFMIWYESNHASPVDLTSLTPEEFKKYQLTQGKLDLFYGHLLMQRSDSKNPSIFQRCKQLEPNNPIWQIDESNSTSDVEFIDQDTTNETELFDDLPPKIDQDAVDEEEMFDDLPPKVDDLEIIEQKPSIEEHPITSITIEEKLETLNRGISFAINNNTTQEALEQYRKCLLVSDDSIWKLFISKCEMRRIDFIAQLIDIGLIPLVNRNIPFSENAQTVIKISSNPLIQPYWIPKITSYPVEISQHLSSRKISKIETLFNSTLLVSILANKMAKPWFETHYPKIAQYKIVRKIPQITGILSDISQIKISVDETRNGNHLASIATMINTISLINHFHILQEKPLEINLKAAFDTVSPYKDLINLTLLHSPFTASYITKNYLSWIIPTIKPIQLAIAASAGATFIWKMKRDFTSAKTLILLTEAESLRCKGKLTEAIKNLKQSAKSLQFVNSNLIEVYIHCMENMERISTIKLENDSSDFDFDLAISSFTQIIDHYSTYLDYKPFINQLISYKLIYLILSKKYMEADGILNSIHCNKEINDFLSFYFIEQTIKNYENGNVQLHEIIQNLPNLHTLPILKEFKLFYEYRKEIESIHSLEDENYQKIKSTLCNLKTKIDSDKNLNCFSEIILNSLLLLHLNACDYLSVKEIIHSEKTAPSVHKLLTVRLLTDAERFSSENPHFLNEIMDQIIPIHDRKLLKLYRNFIHLKNPMHYDVSMDDIYYQNFMELSYSLRKYFQINPQFKHLILPVKIARMKVSLKKGNFSIIQNTLRDPNLNPAYHDHLAYEIIRLAELNIENNNQYISQVLAKINLIRHKEILITYQRFIILKFHAISQTVISNNQYFELSDLVLDLKTQMSKIPTLQEMTKVMTQFQLIFSILSNSIHDIKAIMDHEKSDQKFFMNLTKQLLIQAEKISNTNSNYLNEIIQQLGLINNRDLLLMYQKFISMRDQTISTQSISKNHHDKFLDHFEKLQQELKKHPELSDFFNQIAS